MGRDVHEDVIQLCPRCRLGEIDLGIGGLTRVGQIGLKTKTILCDGWFH